MPTLRLLTKPSPINFAVGSLHRLPIETGPQFDLRLPTAGRNTGMGMLTLSLSATERTAKGNIGNSWYCSQSDRIAGRLVSFKLRLQSSAQHNLRPPVSGHYESAQVADQGFTLPGVLLENALCTATMVTFQSCNESCHLAYRGVPACDRPIILNRSDNLEGSTSLTAITSKSSERTAIT